MDKPKVTPKDFFLWAGAMVTLYGSVFALISLFFDYVNYAFPETLEYFPSDPYSSGVAYEMASLMVLFPLFIVLMWLIRRDIAKDVTRGKVWVRRWALVLTLFLAGAAMAVDLITLIMYFLQGDITMRFVLKVTVVLLVAAAIFMHFLADIWGYWDLFPSRARTIGWASAVLIAVTIGSGFFIIGTPWQARLYRYDEQKVSDLQTVQSQIVNYWQLKEKLPGTLANLNDSISGYTVPVDPQTGDAYVYKPGVGMSFQLCATFNAPTQQYSASARSVPIAPATVGKPTQDSWYHGVGEQCFDRTIDPQLYPPFSKTTGR